MSHLQRQRTHSENRKLVCGLCYRKSKNLRKISPDHLKKLKALVEPQYSLDDPKFQTVLCSGCAQTLSAHSENPENPVSGRRLLKPAYTILTPPPAHNTRTADGAPCPCTVCDIARQSIFPGLGAAVMLEQHWSLLFPGHPYTSSKVCYLVGE